MTMKECILCGKPNSEEHHIVWISQAKYMKGCKLNKMYLCSMHHRKSKGPHKDTRTDLKYKLKLQNQLFKLFNKKDYKYTKKDIKKILGISKIATERLCEAIRGNKKNAYYRIDIITACMGGTLYSSKSLIGQGEYNKRYFQIRHEIMQEKISAVILRPKIVMKKGNKLLVTTHPEDFLILLPDGTYKFEKLKNN